MFQVWSITYNSWVSFVLLLWACVIWMARDRRALALFSAPGLVLYANLLLLLSFCVGLRLSQEELFPGVPGWLLTDLDLQPYPQPGLHLAIKSFYAVSLWLLLRQRVLERQVQAQAEADAQREDSGASHEPSRPPGVLVGVLGSFARSLLVKYWIYICAAMFFIVSFDGKVVVYKIVYVFLFLCWLALYQVHYPTWRRFLKYFWMVVVSYSMMVLIAVYTYQFQTVSAFFNQTLGFSEEGLRDVGLEQFDTTELFSRILLPTAFLLACILQLHYFNEDFLKTTSVHVTSAKFRGASDSLGLNRGKAAMRKLADEADGGTGDWDVISDKAVAGFLKLLEMGTGMQVFLWRVLEIHAVTLVASIVIWLMLQEVSLMNSIFYISWVAALPYAKLRTHARRVCTLWACVVVVCKMMYQLKCVKPSVYSSNCSEVWQENSTHPSAELLATSVLYLQPVDPAEWLGALRKCQDRVLPCLQRQLTILALMTLEVTVRRHQRFHRLQNLLPDPPMDNLTDTITRAHLDDGLLTAFLYFVNYGFYKFGLELCLVAALNAIGQRMDFYSLIHWQVFVDENKALVRMQAGDNVEISRALRPEDLPQLSPVPNFIFYRSYLDMVKVVVFRYHYWFVLCLVFLTGTMRINILGAGYLVAFGYLMLHGRHLLLKPVQSILRPWDRLIAFSLLVVATKTLLSVGASIPEDESCEPPEKEAGILWDTLCFTFLLVQRRIFLSYYHLHVVADLKAAEALAPRYWNTHGWGLGLVKPPSSKDDIDIRNPTHLRPSLPLTKEERRPRVVTCLGVFSLSGTVPTDSSYSLFETDSEEEESVEEGKEEREDHMAKTKTAFQLAYDAWTNSSKSALRLRRQDEGAMERGGERSTAGKAEAETEEGTSEGPDSPIQRLTAAVQLLWVLGKVLLDDVTEAVVTLSGEHVNMVATLRAERHAWWQRVVTEARICRDEELAQSDRFSEHLPRLLKLALAVYQLAESRSEMLCYFVIVLNHTLSASISSMVLPILSFLWAMLSVPRPSKRFWMAAIYYTEVTIVVKYLSQFGFLPWTTKRYTGVNGEKPFSLPNLLGVEKKDGFVLCDLLQLAVLFFHLSTLKDLGLWDQPLSGQTQGQEEKSRKPRRKANQDPEGGDTPGRQAEVGPYFQPLPLGQPGRHWAFWRGRSLQIYQSVRQFFYNLTHPEASPVCDVYALTFLVEVLNFAIVLFGYWAFGAGEARLQEPEAGALAQAGVQRGPEPGLRRKYSAADLAESLAEDKVPEAFLAMVLLQFGTMVVDRALYLRKTLFGKCVFQVLLVFGVHFWLFFILPRVTERRFNLNYVAQLWYLVKCIYFGLSAYQIKCGYPNRILGNFLTKNFSLLNFILFKGFRFVPFLLELRAVVDWIWTDTALSLSSWVCLEGLYADIFIMKCWRESEKKYPQPPGQKKKEVVKYGVGGVIAFALVFLMWFPLVFMSLLKTVGGVTNQPLDVSVKIAINGYEVSGAKGVEGGTVPGTVVPRAQTLFSMSSQQQNLVPFSEAAYDQLTQQYALHPSAMQFLVNYRPEDIVLAKIKSHASLLWNISPANRAAMAKELANATTIYITVSWTIQRNVSLVKNVEASGKHTVFYTDQDTRSQLLRVLTGTREEPILLPALIPKALRTTAGTEAKMALRLDVAHSQRPQDLDRLAFFRTALLRLQQLRPSNTPADGPVAEWWVVQEWRPACNQSRGCGQDLELVVYNDKVSPQSLNFLAGYGIVGLYVSVVMVAAKFIREHFHSVSRSIMFDELPSVDRVLTLCTDIFLVRELGALELEQRLFNKLVFLYRSPETMIKWTRPASPRRPRPDPVAGAAEDSGEGP
ncbi:piezo-type mechanosensitive ion channel component 2-like [Rhynchocyon petersi]